MFPEEAVIVMDLKRLCEAVPEFVLDFMGGKMAVSDELAFGHRLVDLAEQVMHHANAKDVVVLDAEVISVESHGWPARVEVHRRSPGR